MPTSSATQASARSVQEQFWDLICSDPLLLHDQFDAIITPAWPHPPNHRPCYPAGDRRPPPAPPGGESTRDLLAARPRQPGVGGWRRQRSPPARHSRR